MRLKTYMESEERKDFLLESGFLLMSASESQTDKVEQMGQGRGIHSFQTKLQGKTHQAVQKHMNYSINFYQWHRAARRGAV